MNVRLTDPITSHQAAYRAERASTLKARVAQVLHDHASGLTDDEIRHKLGLPGRKHGSIVKRRADLGAVPVLRDGEPVRRLTDAGCFATVWRLP